jgi:hypothetical protein
VFRILCKWGERKDLQRLLRADISVIGDDLMVISEEFGDWELPDSWSRLTSISSVGVGSVFCGH